MPLYEYECDSCGQRFERIQKFSDPPIEQCPKCGGHVHKLVSSPAFQFKGTGWYVTDYARKDSGAKGHGSDSSSGSDTSKAEKSDASAAASKDKDAKSVPASTASAPDKGPSKSD